MPLVLHQQRSFSQSSTEVCLQGIRPFIQPELSAIMSMSAPTESIVYSLRKKLFTWFLYLDNLKHFVFNTIFHNFEFFCKASFLFLWFCEIWSLFFLCVCDFWCAYCTSLMLYSIYCIIILFFSKINLQEPSCILCYLQKKASVRF